MYKVAFVGVVAALAACSNGEQQQPVAAAAATNTVVPVQPAAAPAAAAPVKEAEADSSLAEVAGSYRWTSGFGQGVSEAIVNNNRSETLNISVQADSEYNDGTEVDGSIFLTLDPELGESDQYYILVDGRTFSFVGGAAMNETATDRRQMADLISTLKASKSAFVTVEVPSRNYETAFSTKGIRAALGG